ncbi:MAG: FG-GAP repeat protein [Nannocystaceae bacterium]|nr:FG-GAP repeat protein [Nannocystaceae bacterium]
MSVTRFAVIWGVLLAFALPAVEAHATPWVVSGAVVRGDFDNDGNLETVASSPQSEGTRGVVHVVDGAAGTATRWTRATSGLAGGGAAVGDYFGAALAVGDFDGDGFDDLLVSAPGADDAGPSDSGVLHVIYGSSGGLTTVGDQVFHQNTTGIGGVAEANDQLGDVLTVGDFNCDTYDDVVIGVPMESISSHAAAGAVHVLYGSSAGVTAVDDLYYQSLGGVNGLAEAGDHFGGGLATGNFNGDSDSGNACDDLAIGVPDEAIGAIASAGYVYTLLGGTSGLSTTGDIAFHQNVSGVSDVSESGDRFGLRMFTGDEDGDGYDDLAVVSPGDSCISGHGEAHHVFLGTSSGLTVTGNHIQCASYRCMIDEDTNVYACHSYSPPVYASDSADTIAMFVGNDVVYAGGRR